MSAMDCHFADSEIQHVSSSELLNEPPASSPRRRVCSARSYLASAFAVVAMFAGACVAYSLHKRSDRGSSEVLSLQAADESTLIVDESATGGFIKENVGCSNWMSAEMGRHDARRLDGCRETCQKTRGCYGYSYEASGNTTMRDGTCIWFSNECDESPNAGWVYERMGAPKPQWSGINYYTCNTRAAEKGWPLGGNSGFKAIGNTCVGVEWHGFRTKVEEYLKLATQLADEGSEELLVVCDGKDMFYGGCSDADVIQRYNKISLATGATVIAGAENFQYPQAVFNYGDFDSRREEVMWGFLMRPGNYDRDGHQYRHANSGWMMGPPAQLKEVLECMLDMGRGEFHGTPNKGDPFFDDQHGLHACMFAHPDLVALDYSGTLVTNMAGFNLDGDTVLRRADGVVKNAAAGWNTQCFIHLNGGSWGWVGVLGL